MKKTIFALMGVSVLFLGACGKEEAREEWESPGIEEIMERREAEAAAKREEEAREGLASRLENGSIQVYNKGDLVYIKGTAINKSTQTIDTIGDMVILDSNDNVIAVKKIDIVQLMPGDTLYFDELVGQEKDLPSRPSTLIFQGF